MERESCVGCKHYLGGGCCSIHMEPECREGGGFELYEPKDDDDGEWLPATWDDLWPMLIGVILSAALWGIVLYKLYLWLF